MRIILLIMIGLSLLQAEYIRDNTKEVVLDTTTNLIWQDDNNTSTITKNWTDAIAYCETSTLGGYGDWYLPNKNELKSIADRTTVNPAISAVFQNVISSYYWSSTTYVATPTAAWTVYFYNGNDLIRNKTNTHYVRCVR